MTRRLRIAVDVGGTFTDATLTDPETGRVVSAKILTTPDDLARGVVDGIAAALAATGARPDEVREVVHGSTTGTNALIERTGAKVALLTTEGFRDVLEIGRIMRPQAGLYDFSVDLPMPLVPRHLRLEVRERLDAEGRVLVPLDEASVAAAAEVCRREGVEAVAVCFLFSFLNPEHEERAGTILERLLPRVPISLSCRVCPEIREYERSSTTVMNAYPTPIMGAYLDRLQRRLEAELGSIRLSVIQSNGDSTSVEMTRRLAVTTVNSGPAGRVVAAAYYGRRHARDRLVSVNMGGTSFDIGLVENGTSATTAEGSFQDLPVRIERYEFLADSGGTGTYRGGLALRRDIRLLADCVSFARYGDRHKFPPHGLFGGLPGACGAIVLDPGTPGERRMASKGLDSLAAGDLVSIRLPGAGGYGDPAQRQRDSVAADLRDGKISEESATRDYGYDEKGRN